MKLCNSCSIEKPEDKFPIANKKRSATKRRNQCRECTFKAAQERKANKMELARQRRSDTLRKYKYGLTPSQFEWLLDSQNHNCAICKQPLTGDSLGRIAVDHDHSTGDVRGVLCYSCNWGIGVLKDNVTTLQSAINYLQKSKLELPDIEHPRASQRKPSVVKRPDLAARNKTLTGKPGRQQTEEEKVKRRKPNPKVAAANKGRTHSEDSKLKIKNARLKYWATKKATGV